MAEVGMEVDSCYDIDMNRNLLFNKISYFVNLSFSEIYQEKNC